MMKKTRLNKEEKEIERSLLKGDYQPVPRKEFESIAMSIARRKKDTVLNIRVNSADLKSLKKKSKRLGVAYQTFISEILHRFATS